MDEPLPGEFDIIVVGTGLPESVLSGALSRIDKKVLHIDSNEYYGSNWASFSIKSFDELMLNNPFSMKQKDIDLKELISENEEFLAINPRQCLRHSESQCHVLPVEACRKDIDDTTSEETTNNENVSDNVKGQPNEVQTDSSAVDSNHRPNEVQTDSSADDSNHDTNTALKDENLPNVQEPSSVVAGDADGKNEASSTSTENENVLEEKELNPSPNLTSEVVSLESFYDQWRRFNIDLTSKVVFSRGLLVELLIQSNVCRYLEFRNISRTLTLLSGENYLQPVPCSRADVFKSKFVTVVEKRILMRVLTLCANYQQHSDEYEDFKDKPFSEFLQSKKLSKKAQEFIIHSIAMVTKDALTMEGLSATQKFLQSLGRYGNSAFLFPMYGVGELPQAFSRLSAVFGGTFCLRRHASGIIVDKETRECRGIVDSTGQKIRCKHLVLDEENVPDCAQKEFNKVVSRAIYVTDQSVLQSDTENVSLVTFPPSESKPSIRVVEAGPACCVCPKTNYLLHAVAIPLHDHQSPKELFSTVEDTIFSSVTATKDQSQDSSAAEMGTNVCEQTKPTVLWSAYFDLLNDGTKRNELPKNVYVMNGPGADLGFDAAMQQARDIFYDICPGEEFLPRAPEPEEIIFDEGYDTENNGTPPETSEDNAGEYAEHEDDIKQQEEVEQEQSDLSEADKEVAQSSTD